ncbi:hypothetical protein OOK31_31695 [Streptomyces sp. NBC_00249]|uniref:hypothetical protein n=1 Tax=Streptomyces sp. NBC_00249 TaxID=2975690 RepID=UPI00225B0731|nr:hypothetical protein [Streptomyces sp. NBC_00249]MCX5198395.1 hypothetical protein [Streptomyces sp. NBC_00249]
MSAGHAEFVRMLRRVRDCSLRTQAQIAAAGHIVATSLSNHLNGGRVPEEPQVRAFFTAVQAEVTAAGGEGGELPCSLDELLELRRIARLQHCDCVPHPRNSVSAEESDGSPALPLSAPAAVRPRSHRRRLRSSSRRALSRTAVSAAAARRQVPVPPGEGDRPRAAVAGTGWTELERLAGFIAEGKDRDAGLLLWRAGLTLSAPELINAVASCRTAGFDEAAESVLAGVSERTDRQAVLDITAAFQHAGRHEDVGFLLAASSQ